jgi:uncharacterized protein (TIGR02145 family)
MKKIMKKQCEKLHSWGCKGLLSVALISLVVVAHAQGADVCAGSPYTIASAADASGATTYQWLENGRIISGAKAATYVVPSSNAVGNYIYIRQAKSEDCIEWQSSNEFVVTVFNCSFSAGTETGATATFTDPRDGKPYKTVVMPDGRTWFAQNLNYTKDLTFNTSAYIANGQPFTEPTGERAIGSYWCPGLEGSTSSEKNTCDVYGALYTWNTAMMVDGKYADESKTSSPWNPAWNPVSYVNDKVIGVNPYAAVNAARGGPDGTAGGRGICPISWHIPTLREWAQLFDAVDGTTRYTGTDQFFAFFGGTVNKMLRSSTKCPNTVDDGSGCWLPQYDKDIVWEDPLGFSLEPAGILRRDGVPSNFLNGRGGMSALLSSTSGHSSMHFYAVLFTNGYEDARFWGRARGEAWSVRCVLD